MNGAKRRAGIKDVGGPVCYGDRRRRAGVKHVCSGIGSVGVLGSLLLLRLLQSITKSRG